MKVLLISPNIETLPDPVFPIGLAFISAALKRHHIRHQILDLCFAEDYEAAISSATASFSPDIVGISIRNLDNVSFPNYISYLPFYRDLIKAIKRNSSASIVLGGSGFSLMPAEILRHLHADFGIVGEGEASFVNLVKGLDGAGPSSRAVEKEKIIVRSEIVNDMDELPMPDRSGFDNWAYLELGGMGNIQTKRGCPFKCVYCTYPVIEGRTPRVRAPAIVCDEIDDMIEGGTKSLFFVDNTFNYPVDHAEAVCREIIRRGVKVEWSCYANPGFITPGLVELMLEAGCTGVEFGSDAASRPMLTNLGKNFNVDCLREASSICRRAGMSFCHSILLGGPGESMATIHETLETIRDTAPTAVICMVGIRVFPKTRLSAMALMEDTVNLNRDFLKPVFYLSPAVEHEILPFIEQFSGENPTWIFPGLNININKELQKKLRRFGIKGPLWEYMKMRERLKRC